MLNNIRALLHAHPKIELICFNGETAAKLYARPVIPTLPYSQQVIARRTLPSTRGDHVTVTFAEKAALVGHLAHNLNR
jgi:TDG/mug DNA glycosylase family protein